MKKIIAIVTLLLMTLSFTACMQEVVKNDARAVEELLAEKYNTEFETIAITSRLKDFSDNMITAYCRPKDNERVVFEVVMSLDNKLVFDSYYRSLLEDSARGIIEERFLSRGINATADVAISRLSEDYDLSGKSLTQVISDCPDISLTFTTVLDNKASSDEVYSITKKLLTEFYSGDTKMLLGTTIWRYNKSDYEKCVSGMKNIPTVTKTYLEDNYPLSKVNLAFVNGELNKSLDDFSSSFNNIKLRGDFK